MPGNLSTVVKSFRCKSKYLWSNVFLHFFVGFLAEGRGCRSDSWDTYPSIQHCPSVLRWIQVRETIQLDSLESSCTVKRAKRALMTSWQSLFHLNGCESYYKFTRKKLTCAVSAMISFIHSFSPTFSILLGRLAFLPILFRYVLKVYRSGDNFFW